MPDSVNSTYDDGYASWEEEPLPPLADMTGRGYLPHMIKVKLKDFKAEMLQKIESVDREISADADNPEVGNKIKDIGLNIACRAFYYETKVIEDYLLMAGKVGKVGEPLRKELDDIREKLMEFKKLFPDEQ